MRMIPLRALKTPQLIKFRWAMKQKLNPKHYPKSKSLRKGSWGFFLTKVMNKVTIPVISVTLLKILWTTSPDPLYSIRPPPEAPVVETLETHSLPKSHDPPKP